jgi:hypothetical protein
MNTLWSGVLVNTGRVLLGGNGAGNVENLATGSRTLAGEPDLTRWQPICCSGCRR